MKPSTETSKTIKGYLLALVLLAAPAISSADNIFVASGLFIKKYNSSGVGAFFGSSDYNVVGLAFDSAGNLYSANILGTIQRFNASGGSTVFASYGAGLDNSAGMAFDTAGNLYVSRGDGIKKFDSSGVGTVFVSGLNAASGLAFDSLGNLYEANWVNHNIEKFNSSGVDLGSFASLGLGLPHNLTTDRAGNFYASDPGAGSIEKVNSSGVGSLFANTGRFPTGLGFDSAGNLFVVNNGDGTVEKYNSSGVDLGAFASGLFSPTALAIQPVPEPSTWLLLAGGLIATLWRSEFLQRKNAKP